MKKRVFVRKLPAIIAAAGLLVSLSACAQSSSDFAACTPGQSAALVAANGEFPTPLVSEKPQFAVAEAGDGERITSSDVAEFDVTIYDAETGEQAQEPLSLRTFVSSNYPFTAALACATVGSTIVTTGTVDDLLAPETPSDQQIVIVSEITRAYPAKATGTDQLPQGGFPSVVLAPNGRPGITWAGDAPNELKIAASKQGSGDTVEAGDAVVANVTALVWGAEEPFSSSWPNLAPATLVASSNADDPNGVVPGLAKALVGQQVGSQLLVVVPPEFGYASGTELPAGVADGDTLFFVVDILAIG